MIGNFNAINLKQMYERLSQDEDVLSLKQKYDSEKDVVPLQRLH